MGNSIHPITLINTFLYSEAFNPLETFRLCSSFESLNSLEKAEVLKTALERHLGELVTALESAVIVRTDEYNTVDDDERVVAVLCEQVTSTIRQLEALRLKLTSLSSLLLSQSPAALYNLEQRLRLNAFAQLISTVRKQLFNALKEATRREVAQVLERCTFSIDENFLKPIHIAVDWDISPQLCDQMNLLSQLEKWFEDGRSFAHVMVNILREKLCEFLSQQRQVLSNMLLLAPSSQCMEADSSVNIIASHHTMDSQANSLRATQFLINVCDVMGVVQQHFSRWFPHIPTSDATFRAVTQSLLSSEFVSDCMLPQCLPILLFHLQNPSLESFHPTHSSSITTTAIFGRFCFLLYDYALGPLLIQWLKEGHSLLNASAFMEAAGPPHSKRRQCACMHLLLTLQYQLTQFREKLVLNQRDSEQILNHVATRLHTRSISSMLAWYSHNKVQLDCDLPHHEGSTAITSISEYQLEPLASLVIALRRGSDFAESDKFWESFRVRLLRRLMLDTYLPAYEVAFLQAIQRSLLCWPLWLSAKDLELVYPHPAYGDVLHIDSLLRMIHDAPHQKAFGFDMTHCLSNTKEDKSFEAELRLFPAIPSYSFGEAASAVSVGMTEAFDLSTMASSSVISDGSADAKEGLLFELSTRWSRLCTDMAQSSPCRRVWVVLEPSQLTLRLYVPLTVTATLPSVKSLCQQRRWVKLTLPMCVAVVLEHIIRITHQQRLTLTRSIPCDSTDLHKPVTCLDVPTSSNQEFSTGALSCLPSFTLASLSSAIELPKSAITASVMMLTLGDVSQPRSVRYQTAPLRTLPRNYTKNDDTSDYCHLKNQHNDITQPSETYPKEWNQLHQEWILNPLFDPPGDTLWLPACRERRSWSFRRLREKQKLQESSLTNADNCHVTVEHHAATHMTHPLCLHCIALEVARYGLSTTSFILTQLVQTNPSLSLQAVHEALETLVQEGFVKKELDLYGQEAYRTKMGW